MASISEFLLYAGKKFSIVTDSLRIRRWVYYI